jgi:hypothetical protein
VAPYEWIFVIDELADDDIDAVYEMCDALVSRHVDLTLLTVTAQGGTAVEAAKNIITQLQQERQIIKVQRAYEDLVTKIDIASRCHTTPQAVGQWVRGKRLRDFPFPERFSMTAGGIWLWGDVNDWLRRTGKQGDDIEYPHREDYVSINHWIREERDCLV